MEGDSENRGNKTGRQAQKDSLGETETERHSERQIRKGQTRQEERELERRRAQRDQAMALEGCLFLSSVKPAACRNAEVGFWFCFRFETESHSVSKSAVV